MPPASPYAVSRRALVAGVCPRKRATVLRWVYEVCAECRLTRDACHTSVNLFDRFVSLRRVSAAQLQLVAVTCIFIAVKVCDKDDRLSASELREYTGGAVASDRDIIEVESMVLNALGFMVTPRSAPTFMDVARTDHADAAYRLDVATLDPRYADYTPAALAALVHAVAARRAPANCPVWLLAGPAHVAPLPAARVSGDDRVMATVQTAHVNSMEMV